MGKRFKFAGFILYCLSSAQLANACGPNIPLTKMDVAFAEVIFEGRIREVHPDLSDKSSKLLFDVHDVIRGDVPQKQMTVILQGGFAYSAPKSVEDFVKRYGETSRIALTTPNQVKKLCRIQMVSSVNGLGEVAEVPVYKCDYSLLSRSSKAKNYPVVLRRWCGSPYIYEINAYEKMKNYEANFEKLKSQPRSSQTSDSYKELGGGPLPWDYPRIGSVQNIAIALYRDYNYLFTRDLKEHEVGKDILLSKGLEMLQADLAKNKIDQKNFNKSLWHHILQISSVVEKDRSFGERLLAVEGDLK